MCGCCFFFRCGCRFFVLFALKYGAMGARAHNGVTMRRPAFGRVWLAFDGVQKKPDEIKPLFWWIAGPRGQGGSEKGPLVSVVKAVVDHL